MLDEFGRVDVRDEHGGLEGIVNPFHQVGCSLGCAADDDAIGFHQIWNGATLTKKLGV